MYYWFKFTGSIPKNLDNIEDAPVNIAAPFNICTDNASDTPKSVKFKPDANSIAHIIVPHDIARTVFLAHIGVGCFNEIVVLFIIINLSATHTA